MARPTVLTKFFGWLLLLVPIVARAQGYEISGECSLSGDVSLTLFDGDSSTHTLTARIDRGLFLFHGNVKAPVLASISHPSMRRPLFFYLENTTISMVLNATRPEVSLIKGSRSNSEYRYLLEQLDFAAEPSAFLRDYVEAHPSDTYIPFILYSRMENIDEGLLRQLIGMIAGDARHTYHYTLLRRWMRETPSVTEGSEMPDFTFTDDKHKQMKFSEVRNKAGNTLILVGATWCDRCQQYYNRVQRLAKKLPISILYIRIDDSPAGWDAPFLRQLSIDHLPYAILVDANGNVQARDLREWEVEDIKN